MSRISVLANRPKRVLGALALLLLAVGVAVGSGANFTASSANPSNTFTAGTLAISNSRDDVSGVHHAVLTADRMKPGAAPVTGIVGIGNSGDIAGDFSLSATIDSTTLGFAPGSPERVFAHQLLISLESCSDAVCTVATPIRTNDPLDYFPTNQQAGGGISMGNFVAGATKYYRFSVAFPSTGTNGQDNPLMGKSVSLDLNWSAVQS